MACNCDSSDTITLDVRQVLSRLTSSLGAAKGVTNLATLPGNDYAYHHVDHQSWLTSSAIDAGGKQGRTVLGFIDGIEFDYDFTLELRDGIVEVTLVVRKPFNLTVQVEVDLKTGRWHVKPGTDIKRDLRLADEVAPLGCGTWCIIRCLGISALKCILCGPAWPCWIACLKTSAPGVAVCIAKCCK